MDGEIGGERNGIGGKYMGSRMGVVDLRDGLRPFYNIPSPALM